MMIKNTLFLPLMAAAIGGPFLLMSGEGDKETDSDSSKEILIEDLSLNDLEDKTKSFYQPEKNLTEIFNFNLTPNQVENRWNNTTQSQLNGFRVYRTSILSGHSDQDIVGAITYLFNSSGKLKKIQFNGFSVDPTNLVNLATSQFGFSKSDQGGTEFRPTTFSGHSGSLMLSRSQKYKGQLKIDFEVSR